VKLSNIDGRRWGLFQRRDITDLFDSTDVYLRRWRLIETPWFSVKLHHILRPDADRALHDHPWSFVSVILRGGYTEQVPLWGGSLAAARSGMTRMARRWPGKAHRVRAEGLHRIAQLHGDCWTLVFCGPRRREWGFVPTATGEWVDWRTYCERSVA
jgi:hypothetical protein